jgi:GNAT superfamily N-acetyltransferase
MAPMLTKKTLCLFEVDLAQSSLPDCAARLEVDYQVLDDAAWRAQRNIEHITDRRLFQSRLERGEQFWTAQLDGKIISYCWATDAPVEIGELRRVIAPRRGEIYLYDAFTFPAYRGQNLYPAILNRILLHSRQQDLQRALIFVLDDNVASIRGVQKAGFCEFQRVTYCNLLGFGRYSYQPRLRSTAGVDLLPA